MALEFRLYYNNYLTKYQSSVKMYDFDSVK